MDDQITQLPPPPPPRAVGPSVPLVPQLPPHGNATDRLGQQAKGLVDDVKDWMDLRVKLLQTEIQDQVKGKVNELVFKHLPKVLPILLVGMASFFLLMAIAYGLGEWIGHTWLGFLILAVILGGAGGAIYWWYRREAPLNPRSPHHPGNPDNDDDKNG